MNKRFSIVIPCHNEELAIGPVMKRLSETLPLFSQAGISETEIIVVDDASTDHSAAVLAQWPLVKVIRNSQRLNYGGSLKRGFAAATGAIIGFLDMDATYDPYEFITMINLLQEVQAGMVCGNRLGQRAKPIQNKLDHVEQNLPSRSHANQQSSSYRLAMPKMRFLGNRFFVVLINLLYQKNIRDGCTGQRVFQSRYKEQFCRIPANSLNYSLAMTLHCLRRGIAVVETDIRYNDRIGSSKLMIVKDGPHFALTILHRWFLFFLAARKNRT